MNRLLYSLFESSKGYLGDYDRIFRGFGIIDLAPSTLHRDKDGWYHGIDNFPSFSPETAVKELLWKINGKGDLRSLLKEKVYVWTPFAWRLYNFFTSSKPITQFYGNDSNTEFSQVHKARLVAFEDRILHEDDFAAEWGYIGTTVDEVLNNIFEKAEKYGKANELGTRKLRRSKEIDGKLKKILTVIIDSFKTDFPFRDEHGKRGYHFELIFPSRFPDQVKSIRALNVGFEMKESLDDDVDEKLCSCFGTSECDSYWELPYYVFQATVLQFIIAHFSSKQVGGTELHLWCPFVLESDLQQSKNLLKQNEKKELIVKINPNVKDLESLTIKDFMFKVVDRWFYLKNTGRDFFFTCFFIILIYCKSNRAVIRSFYLIIMNHIS